MYNILKYLSVATESPEIVYSRTIRSRGSCKNNETMTSKNDNTVIIYTVMCVLLLAICVTYKRNQSRRYETLRTRISHNYPHDGCQN